MPKYNARKDRWELEHQRTVCAAWPDWRMWGLPDPGEAAVGCRRVRVAADGTGEWFKVDTANRTIFCGTFAPGRPPGDPAYTVATAYTKEFHEAVGVWQAMPAAA